MSQAKKIPVEAPGVRLSKSRIADGLVCEKKAHLSIFSPDLKAKVSRTQQAQFDAGNEVGERARLLFPGGHLVDRKPWEIKEAQAETQDVIEANGKIIFEATFGDDEYHCRVDVLQRDSEKSPWHVFEVKSGLDPKQEYILDLAIQCWILNRVGVEWEKAHLIHINRACRHPDLSNLFTITDVTSEVREQLEELGQNIEQLHRALSLGKLPEKGIGRHCEEPYECGFKSHCWKDVPEYSVFDLPYGWKLFDKGMLKVSDIDQDELTKTQVMPYRAITEDYFHVDRNGLKKTSSGWFFPIYHLDFETIGPAIPLFEGTGPYQSVPFQFSLHVQDKLGEEPRHFEYLHEDNSDPRKALAEKLCAWIPDEAKTVMAFNAGFEEKVLKTLATMFPEMASKLLAIAEKLVDPHPVIKAHVYHKDFRGSFSLKEVAPTLLGEKWRYSNLAVSDGKIAQVVFAEMIALGTADLRRAQLRGQLLEYCAQDTLAMVHLVNWIYFKAA